MEAGRGRVPGLPWNPARAWSSLSRGGVLGAPAQGAKVRDMSCGAEHSMALTASGEVFAWGWGAYGNLGDGECVDRWSPTKVGAGPQPLLIIHSRN